MAFVLYYTSSWKNEELVVIADLFTSVKPSGEEDVDQTSIQSHSINQTVLHDIAV